MKNEDWQDRAQPIIKERLLVLASLSYEQAKIMPEINDEAEMTLGDRPCSIGTFRKTIDGDRTLVTVIVAANYMGGIYSRHVCEGLVFEHGKVPRAATQDETMMNGG